MEENLKPRRRWFRFSLRTMLVLVTLVCVYLGWAKNWIRQRHEFLATRQIWDEYQSSPTNAPWRLRLLGEVGVSHLAFYTESPAERAWAESLFPEAEIRILPPDYPPTEPETTVEADPEVTVEADPEVHVAADLEVPVE